MISNFKHRIERSSRLQHIRVFRIITYCNSGFPKIKSEGQRFSHEYVRIMACMKCTLQLIELPGIEIGSRSPLFSVFRFWKY